MSASESFHSSSKPPRLAGRREFCKLAAAGFAAGGGAARAAESAAGSGANGSTARAHWCRLAARLADPVLGALAERRLKTTMPIEAASAARNRADVTHLEALGRLLAGLAPWLQLAPDDSPEGRERARLGALARAAIDAATDPRSPDFLNFTRERQPLVDAAFLAEALLRAPVELWRKLDPRVRANVIAALQSSRVIRPGENNWLLFASIIEAFLQRAGAPRDEGRLFEGLCKHRDWYVGDGTYGDGPEFHWDYYNSFVIQPMLVEVLDVVGDESAEWDDFRAEALRRLTRRAAVQERLVAPDGSFPPLGRSLAYRCGAFQGLALAALRGLLPAEVPPAQAHTALDRVIRRTLEAPDTFDADGWLRIGLSGRQPGLGETYISAGSLYLCSVALLPLGLPGDDAFWAGPPSPGSWERAWSGADLPADRALKRA